MIPRSNILLIQTPEGIVFPLLLASPAARCVAWLIDACCIAGMEAILLRLLSAARIISGDLAGAVGYLVFFLISVGYPILMEWFWRGQTLGKRLMRLRVMDSQGLRLQPSQVAVRNLLRFVDSLPFLYAIGGAVAALNRRYQRLGDIAANTVVVRNPELSAPDLAQVMAGKFNSFLEYPHLTARLRQRISPQEAGIALQALLRRDSLDPEARLQLFSEIARLAKSTVEFPADVTEGLTDEQYVRNLVDIVYRK